eukprot:Pgem_evm1s8049
MCNQCSVCQIELTTSYVTETINGKSSFRCLDCDEDYGPKCSVCHDTLEGKFYQKNGNLYCSLHAA